MFIPVVDREQKPLMPTTPARTRKWIGSGKATPFWKRGVFCVRLNIEPSARKFQPIAVGISRFVVEDVCATAKKDRRWNSSFGPLQVGKAWFYQELGKLAPVETKQGWETGELRETAGLKKSSNKLAETFSAHCVDSWVLANHHVGGHVQPDSCSLITVIPLRFHRRQLHRLQPETGGVRKLYGRTRSHGFTRGGLVKHAKVGLAYVGGFLEERVSLHSTATGKRLGQNFKPKDCQFLTFNTWRVSASSAS
jgi:hypothetical protein